MALIEKHYSPQEIADLLGLPVKTIINYLRAGILEGSKIRRRWRVSESAFRQFLEEAARRGKKAAR